MVTVDLLVVGHCNIYLIIHHLSLLLCVFYFILGNIQPKYRSSYIIIQLAAICKVSYISKYSMEAVLKPIVDDMKKLVSCV